MPDDGQADNAGGQRQIKQRSPTTLLLFKKARDGIDVASRQCKLDSVWPVICIQPRLTFLFERGRRFFVGKQRPP